MKYKKNNSKILFLFLSLFLLNFIYLEYKESNKFFIKNYNEYEPIDFIELANENKEIQINFKNFEENISYSFSNNDIYKTAENLFSKNNYNRNELYIESYKKLYKDKEDFSKKSTYGTKKIIEKKDKKNIKKTKPSANNSISIRKKNESNLDNYNRALLNIEKKDFKSGYRLLKRFVNSHPTHKKSRGLLASLALKLGNHNEAMRTIDKGLEIYPKHSPFVQEKAKILVKEGKSQLAINLIKSVAPTKKYHFGHNELLASIYQNQAQHDRAISIYLKLLKIQPKNPLLWKNLAVSLDSKGEYQAALKSYNEALNNNLRKAGMRQYAIRRVKELNSSFRENS